MGMTNHSPRLRLRHSVALSALLPALALLASPALAEEGDATSAPDQANTAGHVEGAAHSTPHAKGDPTSSEIVVVGHPPTNFGLLAATASLSGDELTQKTRSQIGAMLESLPGVSATGFAPGASRPVLRGFSGDRVSVLTDGIGSLDASNVSVDHAVVFDPLTVDHIDVFHGPSILLFGGNAIGGAVNAIDKRIPRQVPDRITATAIGSYGSAADERSVSGAIDVPLADRLVAHVDASWRKSDDLRVGGLVYSPALRSEMLAAADELRSDGEADEADELVEQSGTSGRVPNSAARTKIIGAGIAFIDAGGSLGISYQRYDSRYGVPGRPATVIEHDEGDDAGEHVHGEDPVSIDLVQDRFDLRGEVKMAGLFDSLQVRGAYANYRHTEFEGTETGTVFEGEGIEVRADLIQAQRSGWHGRSGVQYLDRSLTVTGPEAVVPDYRVDRIGVFTMQSLDIGSGFSIDVSGRYDSSRVHSQGAAYSRSFNLWSGAGGVSWTSDNGIGIGANFVHGERAPSPEELLSDGVHVATQAYEIGDPTLGVEKSNGFEAYLHYNAGDLALSLTGYLTNFDNYIAPLATGDIEDFQPVYRYTGVKARFKGFEASGSYKALNWDDGSLSFDASADYTHAQIVNLGPVPRIPPLRIRGGTDVVMGALHLRGEVEWNARQNRVGDYENATAAFTLVNLSADWHPMGEQGPLTLMVEANNLFDVVGRRSASFTSDFVPISGRDIRLTAKITY